MPGLAAVEGVGLALISECSRHHGAVAASVGQPDRPAGAALNAGYPDALDFLSGALPAFPAEQVRALFVVYSAGGLSRHAAGTGNSGCAVSAAAPPVDTCLQNTVAGRQAKGRALEQSCDSTCPILFDAAPI